MLKNSERNITSIHFASFPVLFCFKLRKGQVTKCMVLLTNTLRSGLWACSLLSVLSTNVVVATSWIWLDLCLLLLFHTLCPIPHFSHQPLHSVFIYHNVVSPKFILNSFLFFRNCLRETLIASTSLVSESQQW